MFRIDKVGEDYPPDYPKRPASVYQFYVEEALKNYEICIRCRKKIYPTEKADVGVALHKNCFRCAECNVTLTINSYIIARPDNADCKGIYCKSHAPKPVKYALDDQSMEIQTAVKAQRINKRPSFNKLIRVKDLQGWEYDAKAMEFEHAKLLVEQNRKGRSSRPGRPDRGQTDPREADDNPDAWDMDEADEVIYEDILDRLKQGSLERDKVKDMAHTFGKNRKPPTDLRDEMRVISESFGQFGVDTEDDDEENYWPPPPPSAALSYPSEGGGSSSSSSTVSSAASAEGVVRFTSRDRHETKSQEWRMEKHDRYGRDRERYEIESEDDSIYEALNVATPPRRSRPSPSHQPPRLPHRASDPTIDKAVLADVLLELYRSDPNSFGRGPRAEPRQDPRQEPRPEPRPEPPQDYPIYENIPRYQPPKDAKRDYFKEKTFIEQNELEKRQRHEHGEMFRDITKTREEEILTLETDLRRQMERAVQDLFFKLDQGRFLGDIETEKQNIEQHFQRLKDERMKHLLDKLNLQERMRMDNMIDKQSREMLQLIDKKVPTNLPSPKPPRRNKSQLYEGPHVFDEVDFQAIQTGIGTRPAADCKVPPGVEASHQGHKRSPEPYFGLAKRPRRRVAQHEQGSFTELIYELTRNCRSALEKARAVFRWVTVKDLNKMIFSEEPLQEDNPYYFLKGIKYGLESYHELFKRLCSYAGLKVKTIRGVSKSVGYKPGMPFNDNRFRNSWAVVHIDGSWRFIDCHWGARHVSNNRENDNFGSFCYELDEFFFMTDPEEHIHMHFPDEPEWQLLPRHYTLDEFINLPVVKSHFFSYGLTFSQDAPAVIESENGKVELVLHKKRQIHLAFNTRLEAEEEVLDGYCIHNSSEKEIVFNLSLPRKGTFYFTIFACDTDKADSYNNMCSIKIKCHSVITKPFCKFPRLPQGYGITALGNEVGLRTEKYSEFYLVCSEDKMILNIKFRAKVKVSHRMMSAMFEEHDETLTRLTFQRYRDHQIVSYLLRFPVRGVYLFSVFAANKESGSPMLECACRYLIQVNVNPKSPIKPYPKAQPNWIKCRLHEPSSGDLKLNKNVKFKLEVQEAAAVAVIVGAQWFYLKQTGGGKVWEGMAFTGRDPEATADVYARYSSDVRDFYPLLEYKLVEDD